MTLTVSLALHGDEAQTKNNYTLCLAFYLVKSHSKATVNENWVTQVFAVVSVSVLRKCLQVVSKSFLASG